MRKIFWTLAVVGSMAVVAEGAQAQTSVGPVAAYHDDAESLGVGGFIRLPLASVHPNLAIVPNFVIYFPDGFDFLEVNGDLTYRFAVSEDAPVTPFALAGLNVSRASFEIAGESESETDVGLNLGGGVTFPSSSLQPFAGLKFEIQDGSSFVIFGGVGFALGG